MKNKSMFYVRIAAVALWGVVVGSNMHYSPLITALGVAFIAWHVYQIRKLV